jgi:hypothetical protein
LEVGDSALIVAARQLTLAGAPVTLQILQPTYRPGQDWVCHWQLIDAEGNLILNQDGFGVDSLQALIAVILTIGVRLRAESDDFAFLDETDLGLPMPTPGNDGRVITWGI